MSDSESVSLIKNISPRSAALFGLGFVVATTVLVVIAVAILGDIYALEPGDSLALAILSGNAILILALALVVIVRVRRRIRGRRFGEPAPRLHLRFVGLFSIAAAAPAVFSAIFLGAVLSRGVEYWFGDRVETFVETASSTANQFFTAEAERTAYLVNALAEALEQEDAVEQFVTMDKSDA